MSLEKLAPRAVLSAASTRVKFTLPLTLTKRRYEKSSNWMMGFPIEFRVKRWWEDSAWRNSLEFSTDENFQIQTPPQESSSGDNSITQDRR